MKTIKENNYAAPSFFRSPALLVGLVSAAVLAGCATPCCGPIPPSPTVAGTNKLSATGYGSPSSYGQYTSGQQKLMAIRAAQVDAYRNLAEQVYGFQVSGSTSVSAFATQSDKVRSNVDAFIRGARVVNTAMIADGNVEVTVELDLTPKFFNCLSYPQSCAGTFPVNAYTGYPGCTAYGCVSPSAYYYSY